MPAPKNNESLLIRNFFPGNGEMVERIKAYDWNASPLGEMSTWPQSLLTTLSIVVNSKFPMFLWWGKDLIQFYNDAYRPSLGNNGKHPAALGQKGVDCWQEIWPVIKPLIDTVLDGGEATWSEDQLIPIYRNGQLEDVYWTFSYSPVKDETGNVGGVLVVCTESTNKINTLKKLQQHEEELLFAIEAAELATFDYDPKTNLFKANDRLKEWFGLAPKDEIDLGLAINAIADNDKERVTAAIQASLNFESGGKYNISYSIINPLTGIERIVNAKGKCSFADDKTPYRLFGTLQDITNETISRKKIESSEENLRNIIEQAPIAMVLFKGPELIVDIVNKHILAHWGRTEEETIGRPVFEVLPETKNKGFEELLMQVFRTGKTYSAYDVPVSFIRNGKEEIIFLTFIYEAYRDRSGEITGVMAVSNDVTEQVLARQIIEQTKARESLAIETAELGTYEIDLVTDEMRTSERFRTIWGIENTTLRSQYADFIHPEDRILRVKAHEESLKSGNLFYEARLLRKDNSVDWIRVKGKVIYDPNGHPNTLLGVIQNITEQKLFAEQLKLQVKERTRELQRSNEDLLQFAHVTSHDLKEPVRKIKTFNSRLSDEYGDLIPEKGKAYINKMHHAADRIFAMINGVLNYSALNSSDASIEKIDLNEIIKQIEIDLEITIQNTNARINISKLPVVEGAAILLHQLFYNLITNAIKFARKDISPVITLSSRIIKEDEEDIAEITVTDNGIGFEKEYSEKIFAAFARLHSKDIFEGTGLGLALCKKIVERHHGQISANSEINSGSVFTILLPLKQPYNKL